MESSKGEKGMKYEEISKYSDRKFKRVVGVDRTTFRQMLEILNEEYEQRHLRGRSTKLSLEDMLLVAMEYWYEKRTYEQIAASYKLAASNVCRSIKWIEEVLGREGTFQVPGNGESVEPVVRKIPEMVRKRSTERVQF